MGDRRGCGNDQRARKRGSKGFRGNERGGTGKRMEGPLFNSNALVRRFLYLSLSARWVDMGREAWLL